MAFNSIVEGTLRMNAKMISMGQSLDIQKMPRPKPGTQMAQKKALYVPDGTDIEKMLYPKNFAPTTYEASETNALEKKEDANVTAEVVEQAVIEAQAPPKIIGDDDVLPTQSETQISDSTPAPTSKPFPKNAWESCKHYKAQGDRAFCREYLGWCAKGKCTRPKY